MERNMFKSMAWVLALASLVAFAGCYNTNGVKNGGLVCGANDACPEGFECQHEGQPNQGGHCYRKGTGPTDAAVSTTDTGHPADSAGGAGCLVSTYPSLGPFTTSGCDPKNPYLYPQSSCDPVCQTGCPCNQRCILDVSTNNSFLCEGSSAAGMTLIAPLAACSAPNKGSCAAGSVCVDDIVCPSLCYKTCRGDADCSSNARCTAVGIGSAGQSVLENLFLCSPPVESCNPTGSASCASPKTGFACVFLAGMTGVASSDSTVCDCASLHDKKVGERCSSAPRPDDCQPGAVCINGTCRTVCSLATTTSGCSSGKCNAVYGSKQYGYCQ
jgi:hypothetical protein